jgi:hypothetical protein
MKWIKTDSKQKMQQHSKSKITIIKIGTEIHKNENTDT